MARFAVVGLGTFGAALVKALMERGHEVLALDSDVGRVDAMRDEATQVVALDARDPDALRAQGVGAVDTAVVALGDAFETAVLASVSLKQDLRIPRVVARARTRRERRILEAVGVDQVTCPEEEAGLRLGQILTDPEIHDWYEIGLGFSVCEVETPALLDGRTVAESGLRERHHLNLVAIRRVEGGPGTELVLPGPDTVLKRSDRLVVAGRDRDLKRFIEID